MNQRYKAIQYLEGLPWLSAEELRFVDELRQRVPYPLAPDFGGVRGRGAVSAETWEARHVSL